MKYEFLFLKYSYVIDRVFVSCSKLALEKAQTIRQALSGYISEAIDYVPSLVILDDIDSVIASSSDMAGSQPSSFVIALT